MAFFKNSLSRLGGKSDKDKRHRVKTNLSGLKREEINAIIRKEKRRANQRLFVALGIGVLLVGILLLIAIVIFEII
jgi:hypothetical protein